MSNSNNSKNLNEKETISKPKEDVNGTFQNPSQADFEKIKEIQATRGEIIIKFTDDKVYIATSADLYKVSYEYLFQVLSQLADHFGFTLLPISYSDVQSIVESYEDEEDDDDDEFVYWHHNNDPHYTS